MRSVLNAFTHWYCKVHARELYALSFLIANTSLIVAQPELISDLRG